MQLDVKIGSFEEAIERSMQPLKEDGAVTQGYINEIIKIYHDMGPYIVLMKNVALPHAPSHLGAKRLAIGFTRLEKAVFSGNKDNDPVKFLFPLSAPDNHSHLELLSELADLLGKSSFLNKIATIKSPEELIDSLKTYEGDKNV